MRQTIGGVLPVIPTPFRDGEFDPESFQRLLDHMLDDVDGYTLLGSTGEAPSLTVAERLAVAEAAIAMTPAGKKVVVGVTSTSIADTVELARHAEAHGAAAVLCAAPFYFENTPTGLLAFMRELDAAIGIELVLYDNPAATKTKIAAADVVAWATVLENLSTVKLTDHDLDKVAIWHQAGLRVIGGDDPILFEYLDAGVDGTMMIAPAVFPAAFREVWQRVGRGDREGAFDVFSREILPFVHVFGIGREIATTKALLADVGIFASGETRAPLEPVSTHRREILRYAFDAANGETERRLATAAGGTV
ncbi:MAG: dihydrodipicolinate synthase family protein [Actinobacteria bacterium]|nr:dihydrodipicolinate synthase family protein [Actinomycetota bacterium]MBS1882233.1 dihydrodipicolinate synthase family protein [Actinomycetota bacterium]